MRSRRRSNKSQRRRRVYVLLGTVVLEGLPVWLRTHRLGGDVLVRCRQGHVFTTIWIPGASLKALRLGPWRVQYCPVGRHWTIVSPVSDSQVSEDERQTARQSHDIRIP